MATAMTKLDLLQKILLESTTVRTEVDNLKSLPLAQLRMSDKFTKVSKPVELFIVSMVMYKSNSDERLRDIF